MNEYGSECFNRPCQDSGLLSQYPALKRWAIDLAGAKGSAYGAQRSTPYQTMLDLSNS